MATPGTRLQSLNLRYLISVYAEGTLASRLYALPEQRARYRQRLAELNETLWDVPTLLADLEALQRLVPEGSASLGSIDRGEE